MALLTADDVLNKKFQATKFREGYDQDEVDDFLDEVVNTLRVTDGGERRPQGRSSRRRSDGSPSSSRSEQRRARPFSPAARSAGPAQPPVVQPEPEPEPEPEPVSRGRALAAMGARCARREPESATGMLQLAQKLHDDYVRAGQEEGDRIIDEAKVEAARIVREAEETSQQDPHAARAGAWRCSSGRSTSCGCSSATTARV